MGVFYGRVQVVFISGTCTNHVFSKQLGSVNVQVVFVSRCVRALFVFSHVWVVFVSGQLGSGRIRAVFMSGQEFAFGCVSAVFVFGRLDTGCVRQALSPNVSGQRLSPGRVYSITCRKWISDIILFPSSLLFYAESF